MSLNPEAVENLEQSGGLILDQLVAVNSVTLAQKDAILTLQEEAEKTTGNKPYVGELLEANGIDVSDIKQPLLNLQASARALLYSHGEKEAAERAEGGYGAINLAEGVPDNKWTVKDLESGDPEKELTAELQTRLLQTKLLTTAASELETNGLEVPEATINGIRAAQDAAREGLISTIGSLREAGQDVSGLEDTLAALPVSQSGLNREDVNYDISSGVVAAINELGINNVITPEQAQTVLSQEEGRYDALEDVRTKQAAREAEIDAQAVEGVTHSPPQESWREKVTPPAAAAEERGQSGGRSV